MTTVHAGTAHQHMVDGPGADSVRYTGIPGISADPVVSADVVGLSGAAIIDLDLTRVVDGRLVKVMAWYDDEWDSPTR